MQLWGGGTPAPRAGPAQHYLPSVQYNTLRQYGPVPISLAFNFHESKGETTVSAQPGQLVRGKRKLQLSFAEKLIVPPFGGEGWLQHDVSGHGSAGFGFVLAEKLPDNLFPCRYAI